MFLLKNEFLEAKFNQKGVLIYLKNNKSNTDNIISLPLQRTVSNMLFKRKAIGGIRYGQGNNQSGKVKWQQTGTSC